MRIIESRADQPPLQLRRSADRLRRRLRRVRRSGAKAEALAKAEAGHYVQLAAHWAMNTRIAVPGDAREVARLISLAYRVEDFFKIGDRTDEADVLARMKKSVFLLIEDEAGTLVGSVYVDVRGETGYFGMLSVDPSHQGQGLGSRLIAAAEDYCRNAGCRQMELEVVNLRTELPPLYRRFGYVESGTRPFFDHEQAKLPCHLIVMTKSFGPGA